MIAYSELYEALRKEKYNDKLQKLPKDFLGEIETYFKEKKAIASKEDDSFNDEIKKTKKQLEQAKSVLRELMGIRQKKILNLAWLAAKIGIDKRDTENMLYDERELLAIITKKIEEAEKKISSTLNGLASEKKDLKNTLLRFNDDVPEFLDSNSRTLGPFKQGDVANLPAEIANILIESGQAVLIEAE